MKGILKGMRRYLADEDQIVEVDLEFHIYPSEYFVGQDELRLVGGPSGFEGLIIDKNLDNLIKAARNGWRACVGTLEVYDELIIEPEEMKRVLAAYLQYTNLTPGGKKPVQVTEQGHLCTLLGGTCLKNPLTDTCKTVCMVKGDKNGT